MAKKEKKTKKVAESHNGFQRFNLIRHITREWIERGYRDYEEYSTLRQTTYLDQVKRISDALSPYIKWPENKATKRTSRRIGKIQIENLRVERNPLYSLFKSRSMKSGENYYLHFALLEMLQNSSSLSLAEIRNQLGEKYSEEQQNILMRNFEGSGGFASLTNLYPGAVSYKYAYGSGGGAQRGKEALEIGLSRIGNGKSAMLQCGTRPPIVTKQKNERYSLHWRAAENVLEYEYSESIDLAVAMIYILRNNRKLTIDDIQKELYKFNRYGCAIPQKIYKFNRCGCAIGKTPLSPQKIYKLYRYGRTINKTTLFNRLKDFYIPSEVITKNSKGMYSLSRPQNIQDMLTRYPGLKRAIAFYSEYSPLGVIGSCLMDTYGLDDNSIVFKDEYIIQALDAIVLYDILLAIQDKRCVEARIAKKSITRPDDDCKQILPLKVLTCAGDGRRYIFSYDLVAKKYRSLRLDYIYNVSPLDTDLDEPQIEQIRDEGNAKLQYVWTSFVGGNNNGGNDADVVFPVRVALRNRKQFLKQEIARERRNGEIAIKEDDTVQFTAEVYHPKDLVPWLLSHTGDVTALAVDKNKSNETDTSNMYNRYCEHIRMLHEMYQGTGEPRDISKYTASPDLHAWYGELSSEQKKCSDYIREHLGKSKQVKREDLCALIQEAKEKCGVETSDGSVSEDELLLYQRLVCTKKIRAFFEDCPRTKKDLISKIVQFKKQLGINGDETLTFEAFKAKGLLERPRKYPPINEDELKRISPFEDSSPLFHQLRSKYINCINYVLMKASEPRTKLETEELIISAKKKYGIYDQDKEVSFETLCSSGMIQKYSRHATLTGARINSKQSKDLYCSYLLGTSDGQLQPCPILPHEEAWLRTILADEKITLFLKERDVAEIKAELGDGQLLYKSDDIICVDQHKDGDDFSDSRYQEIFSFLQEKILSGAAEVNLWYQTEKEKRAGTEARLYHVRPLRLEYSGLGDKIWLISSFSQYPPEDAPLKERDDSGLLSLRLSNISRVEESDGNGKLNCPISYNESTSEEPLKVRVYNIYDALERFMLMFSMYKKEVIEYEVDMDTCLIAVWYSKRDENEVLKKIRSLGSAVEVLEPDGKRRYFAKLVERQYNQIINKGK